MSEKQDRLCVNVFGRTYVPGKAISPELRDQIITLAKAGIKNVEIGRQLGVAHSTASKVIRKYKVGPNFKKAGKRRVMTPQLVRKVHEMRHTDPGMSIKNIRDRLLQDNICNSATLPSAATISRCVQMPAESYASPPCLSPPPTSACQEALTPYVDRSDVTPTTSWDSHSRLSISSPYQNSDMHAAITRHSGDLRTVDAIPRAQSQSLIEIQHHNSPYSCTPSEDFTSQPRRRLFEESDTTWTLPIGVQELLTTPVPSLDYQCSTVALTPCTDRPDVTPTPLLGSRCQNLAPVGIDYDNLRTHEEPLFRPPSYSEAGIQQYNSPYAGHCYAHMGGPPRRRLFHRDDPMSSQFQGLETVPRQAPEFEGHTWCADIMMMRSGEVGTLEPLVLGLSQHSSLAGY